MSSKTAEKSAKPDKASVVSGNKSAQIGGFLMEQGGTSFNESEWEDKSLPPLIKAKDFTINSVLMGFFEGITSTDIPNTKKKGALITIKTEKGRVSIPATTVIIRSLEITGIDDGKPTSKLIGREIMIRSTGAVKTAKKGMRDFWGFDVKVKKA